MKNDEEIFTQLIKGGLIGATLSSLISRDKNKKKSAALGAIAGAAILATYRAHEKAVQSNIPMYYEENGNLFLLDASRNKTLIRKLDKPTIKAQKQFKLT